MRFVLTPDFVSRLKLNFVVPIVSGLNGPPHRLLRAKVASFEKTWARVACVLSVSTSFQAVAALWIAAVPPNKVVTLGSSTEGLAMRCVKRDLERNSLRR